MRTYEIRLAITSDRASAVLAEVLAALDDAGELLSVSMDAAPDPDEADKPPVSLHVVGSSGAPSDERMTAT